MEIGKLPVVRLDKLDPNYLKEPSSPFQKLRDSVLKEIDKAVEERKRTNPQATDLEYHLGIYIEELEPQVRDAVLELTRKGYCTTESGFGGKYGELQYISGWFNVDNDTRGKLKAMSVGGLTPRKNILGQVQLNEHGEYFPVSYLSLPNPT